MKKAKWLLIAALVSGMIFLVACGDDSDQEEDNGADIVPEEQETDTDTDNPEVDEDEETNNDAAENETDETDNNADAGETESDTGEADQTESSDENDNSNGESEKAADEQIVMENEAFRIFEPAENAVVGNEFTVRGEARVHEANVSYEFEDGHNILDEGFVTAETAAPDWGAFEITISFDEVWNNSGTVIIYEEDMASGDRKNQIYIPVTVE